MDLTAATNALAGYDTGPQNGGQRIPQQPPRPWEGTKQGKPAAAAAGAAPGASSSSQSRVPAVTLDRRKVVARVMGDLPRQAEKDLASFLHERVDSYAPTHPEAATRYYLEKAGVVCTDPRLLRLVSLAADKFMVDALADARQYRKRRFRDLSEKLEKTSGSTVAEDWMDRRLGFLATQDVAASLKERGMTLRDVPGATNAYGDDDGDVEDIGTAAKAASGGGGGFGGDGDDGDGGGFDSSPALKRAR
ncbi:unnamed protein product [Phaeothamnion confervicola]